MRFCNRRCQFCAQRKRYKAKWLATGCCVRCGKPSFPYRECTLCRAKDRQRQREATFKTRRARSEVLARPRISRKPMDPDLLDALARFNSITEGALRSNPPSRYATEVGKHRSPNKGTQDRRVPK